MKKTTRFFCDLDGIIPQPKKRLRKILSKLNILERIGLFRR